jgi:hypothetical protein
MRNIDEPKRDSIMKHFTMNIDGDRVRFTPDGKIAIVDAIKALGAREGAGHVWESLKREHPEFEDICEGYIFQDNKRDWVVDGAGWEEIENALLDHILDH